jgi:hypothetical protein
MLPEVEDLLFKLFCCLNATGYSVVNLQKYKKMPTFPRRRQIIFISLQYE